MISMATSTYVIQSLKKQDKHQQYWESMGSKVISLSAYIPLVACFMKLYTALNL